MPRHYDRQVILNFLIGEGDRVIQNSSLTLQNKWQRIQKQSPDLTSPAFEMVVNEHGVASCKSSEKLLRAGLAGLTNRSRLFINGHGNFKFMKVAQMTGEQMAEFLKRHGLQQVLMISVLACAGGREKDAPPATPRSTLAKAPIVSPRSSTPLGCADEGPNGVSIKTEVGARVFETLSFDFEDAEFQRRGRRRTERGI